MEVSEFELGEDGCTLHGKPNNNQGVNKENSGLLQCQDVNSVNQDSELSSRRHDSSDSSSLFSSEASLEDLIQPKLEDVGFTSPPKDEQKCAPNPLTIANRTSPPMHIPTTQTMEREGNYNPDRIPKDVFVTTESLPPMGWSDASNASSLFSINPGMSFGGDHALMVGQETCKSNEPTKLNGMVSSSPSVFVEPSLERNVGQEKILETKEPPQDKTKQCGGKTKSPNATGTQSNASHHSTGSESSSYSFAFPILVPGVPQRPSKKSDVNPQGRISLSRDEHHADGDNSISRPNPPPSSHKKGLCFCCSFPCPSIFSKCFSCSSC